MTAFTEAELSRKTENPLFIVGWRLSAEKSSPENFSKLR